MLAVLLSHDDAPEYVTIVDYNAEHPAGSPDARRIKRAFTAAGKNAKWEEKRESVVGKLLA